MSRSAPWMDIAGSYLGMKEVRGKIHNPTIVGWLRNFARNIKPKWIDRKGDEIAWCAVFVSHCLAAVGLPTTEHGLAVKYATYGKPSNFKKGAIIVIRRKRNQKNTTGSNRGGYHVGFLVQHARNSYKIRGGNQRNRVSDQVFLKRGWELVAVRWPSGI